MEGSLSQLAIVWAFTVPSGCTLITVTVTP